MTDALPAIPRFQDFTVRDLAWLLFSPDLLSEWGAGAPLAGPASTVPARQAVVDWLRVVDLDPAAIHASVHRPGLKRLGFYAEALLEYFLAHGPAAKLIAANIPLRAAGQTLGEIDFLLENQLGERLHWELAVKFYLHVGTDSMMPATLASFVGPNLQDRLDLKRARLLQHQLKLSARDEFASLGFGGSWRAELFVKGRLFYRAEPSHLPMELAVDHLRGWWQTVSDWRDSVSREADAVVMLPRLDWLAERNHAAYFQSPDLTSLQQPVMVALYDRVTGHERSRGFIVPDDWPERAARFTTT